MSTVLRGAMTAMIAAAVGLALALPAFAHGDEDHEVETMLDHMREMHKGHHHSHDFEAIDEMSPEQMDRLIHAMRDIGLALPPMDSHRGHELFVGRGCIVCHQINGVGGEIGPSLNAADMPVPMNAFEFAARMWRGAAAMIAMQQELFGEQIALTGQDLADLVAFAHDGAEQSTLSRDEIPETFQQLIDR